MKSQVEFICDGCGARAPGFANDRGDWFKPQSWFQRTDKDGTQVACSRECIEKVSKATDKLAIVFPM